MQATSSFFFLNSPSALLTALLPAPQCNGGSKLDSTPLTESESSAEREAPSGEVHVFASAFFFSVSEMDLAL